MKESLATFRKAVNESADLQEKLKGGTDLVELGKENGYDFSQEDVTAAFEELKDSDEELSGFESQLRTESFGRDHGSGSSGCGVGLLLAAAVCFGIGFSFRFDPGTLFNTDPLASFFWLLGGLLVADDQVRQRKPGKSYGPGRMLATWAASRQAENG